MPADPLSRLSLAGAVPLDPRPPAAPPPSGTAQAADALVVDVTEATFASQVVERSRQVPVVLDFWASWCAPCRQLSPVLERLAGEAAGAWVLAKVDVDANPRLAQAAAVQGIPAVKAVVDGAVVAEFTGALPEAEVRRWLAALLQAAGQAEQQAGELDAELEQAVEALQRGDLAAAEAAFRRLAERAPGDPAARAGLAQVGLLQRTAGQDLGRARAAAQADPANLAALCDYADLLLLADQVEEALARLVDGVRRTAGADRDRLREHLLGLFDVLGDHDPRVAAARRALAAALF